MEIKANEKNNSNKSTKFNVKFDKKVDTKMQLLDFYNQNIRKIHIIVSVIMIILYIFSFIYRFNAIKSGEYKLAEGATIPNFMYELQQNLVLDLVIIIAGITPFCFIPVIGVAQAITVVGGLSVRYALGGSFMITAFLGGLIQVFAVALCVSVGLYYCRLTTKKNKYYNQSGFGIDDIKLQVYQIRKQEEKIQQIEKKQEEKNRKIAESNVKIPYLNFMLLGVIAFVIQFIGILISII